MYDDSNPAIQRLREICLALPEVFEKEAWGECTFRVAGGSMFAMTDNHHHGSERVAVWVKAPPMVQDILTHADPKRFFVPPYLGPKGWVGVRLDYKVDWKELAAMMDDAYTMSAPKRLHARLKSTGATTDGKQIPPAQRSAKRNRAPKARKTIPVKRTKKIPSRAKTK